MGTTDEVGQQVGRYLGALTRPLLWGLLVGGTGMALFPDGEPAWAVVAVVGVVLGAVKPPRGHKLVDLPERSKLLRVVVATAAAVAAGAVGIAPSLFVLGAVLHLAYKAMRWRPVPVAVVAACVGVLLAAGWVVPTGGPHVLLTSGDAVSLGSAGRDLMRFLALAIVVVAATQDQRVVDAAAAETERAVRDERVRIARELHDVVAHHVSVMTIQSEAARSQLPPESSAARAVAAAAESGRTAMTELRRLLGVLRASDDDTDDLVPQPGLDDLERLLADVRATGARVELDVDGEPPTAVSDGLALSAYRIVQESLTNAMRHAPGAPVVVRVAYGPSAMRVEVESRGPVAKVVERGHGIVGMQERARLVDGVLTAGPSPDGGGWLVRADLPLDAPVPSA